MEQDIGYLITELTEFKERLVQDVHSAYSGRGSAFGNQRFSRWLSRIDLFLDNNLPGQSRILRENVNQRVYIGVMGETDAQRFWREKGDPATAFLDSLIMDIQSGEYEDWGGVAGEELISTQPVLNDLTTNKKVFIVHGHDKATKVEAARFVEKLGFEAIILHEQVSGNKTIIEKIEAHSNVGFAIILYTPDDSGNDVRSAADGNLNLRARQNVVFEHGYLMGKIGRSRVVTLKTADVELPSDVHGMVYVTTDRWELDVAREMRSLGYDVDLNKLN